MSTEAKEETKVEGKKAGEDAPPVNIGWDSHKAVVSIDESSTMILSKFVVRSKQNSLSTWSIGSIYIYISFRF